MNKAVDTRRRNEEARKEKRQREQEEWEKLKTSLMQIASDANANPETRLEAIKILEQHR